MSEIECVYGLHFSEIAERLRENFEFKDKSLGDLIDLLDDKYEGFKKELIDPETGGFTTRNQIMLTRKDESARPLFSPNDEILDGDLITFY